MFIQQITLSDREVLTVDGEILWNIVSEIFLGQTSLFPNSVINITCDPRSHKALVGDNFRLNLELVQYGITKNTV